jgi:hypothetical protein
MGANVVRIVTLGTVSRFSIRKATSLLILVACFSVSGCHRVSTIWSAEARSPDGHWLAIARTDQSIGPGTNFDVTVVYLKRTGDSQPPTQILFLIHDEESGSDSIDLKMNWLMPSHLEVTYREHPTLDFQAVKCAGIDISVRDLSIEKTHTLQ